MVDEILFHFGLDWDLLVIGAQRLIPYMGCFNYNENTSFLLPYLIHTKS